MNCKYCQSPLEDGNPVCPFCGLDNGEDSPAPEALQTPQPAEPASVEPTEALIEEPMEETTAEPAPQEEADASEETGPAEAAYETERPESEQDDWEDFVEEPGDAEPAPEKPQKKPINKKKLGILLGAVALVAALAVAAALLIPRWQEQNSLGEGDVTLRDSYTLEDSALTSKTLQKVVAKQGDATLTNAVLQIYYRMEYYNFLQSYGNMATYFGLDTSKPLGQQTCGIANSETPMTWEQFFLDSALSSWARYQALVQEAQAAGFTLGEDYQKQLDEAPAGLESSAQENGFDSAQAMLEADFGPGATLDAYMEYLRLYYTGYAYFSEEYEKLSPSEQDISDYYDANAEEFAQSGVNKDETPATVDVRHILIQPEGEKAGKDEAGNAVYSEEQMKQAKEKAQKLYDLWKDGPATEDSFADLVEENSADTGSSSKGGLYTGVTPGQMAAEFNDWCFNPVRKTGDTDLVQTSFGVHIMYFVSASEDTYWHAAAYDKLMSQKSTELVDSALEAHPFVVNYKTIALGEVVENAAY